MVVGEDCHQPERHAEQGVWAWAVGHREVEEAMEDDGNSREGEQEERLPCEQDIRRCLA